MPVKKRPPSERFWNKVEPTGFCWNWTGGLAGGGYGLFMVERGVRQQVAHRFAYEDLVGPVPEGMELDHLCRNKRCVNPDHLEPVPGHVNRRRARGTFAWLGTRTHCAHGHEYTPENTRLRSSGDGRDCRACNRATVRRRYYRLKESR